MKETFSCLHPNPGWENCYLENVPASEYESLDEMIGKHCILELYECDQSKLNDEAFIRTSLTSASKVAGATLLNMVTHRFEPQGVTGLALLAESHISIHTWPESRYAAIDVFTCGQQTMPEKACKSLFREFAAKTYLLKSFQRETPVSIKDLSREP